MVSFKKIEYIYHIHDITFRQDTDTDELLTFAKKQGYKHLFFTEHLPIGTNDSKDRPTIYRLKKFRDEIMSKAPKYNIEVEFGIEAE
jgi:histidinol phosphatase-like PHP family hydrolase